MPGKAFGAVIVTDGSGSPRSGVYASYTDEEMQAIRMEEQKKAAVMGDYAMAALRAYPSSAVKDAQHQGPITDLVSILRNTQPAPRHEWAQAAVAASRSPRNATAVPNSGT